MTKRRGALWLMAVLAVFALGCEVGDTPHNDPFPAPVERPKANPTPNPAPHNQPNPAAPETVQGPPVVNGDPGPHNDSHFVVYQVSFVTKREIGGDVEYIDQNGHTVRYGIKSSGRMKAGSGKAFGGQWEHIERAHLGIPMGFTWFPIEHDTWAMCTLIYNGTPVDYQIVPNGPCAVSFTLPGELPQPKNPGK